MVNEKSSSSSMGTTAGNATTKTTCTKGDPFLSAVGRSCNCGSCGNNGIVEEGPGRRRGQEVASLAVRREEEDQQQQHPHHKDGDDDYHVQERELSLPARTTTAFIHDNTHGIGHNHRSSSSSSASAAAAAVAVTCAASASASTIVFGLSLASSTLLQQRVLRISTGTAPIFIPCAIGLLSVSLSSTISHLTSVITYRGISDFYGTVASGRKGGGRMKYGMSPGPLLREVGNHSYDGGSRTNGFIRSSSAHVGHHWVNAQRQVRDWWWGGIVGGHHNNNYNSEREDVVSFQIPSFLFLAGSKATNKNDNRRRDTISIPMNHIRVCCLGLLVFKLLGGRFWSISPSSYTARGSFGRISLPAVRGTEYASRPVREQIELLGKRFGCHTCGSRRRGGRHLFTKAASTVTSQFHADHIPPNAITKRLNAKWYRRFFRVQVQQRFYPQCTSCSNVQGGILARASSQLISTKKRRGVTAAAAAASSSGTTFLRQSGGGVAAYYHGLRPRLYHLTGGIIGIVTVANASASDVAEGNRKRFKAMEDRVRRGISDLVAPGERE